MTRDEAFEFATAWIDAWNRRDVDAVLAHYVEDAEFISPKAASFVGTPVLRGKKALSEYCHIASRKLKVLEFRLDRVMWDAVTLELAVIYEANLDGNRTRACELMRFDRHGNQLSGEALYGASL